MLQFWKNGHEWVKTLLCLHDAIPLFAFLVELLAEPKTAATDEQAWIYFAIFQALREAFS